MVLCVFCICCDRISGNVPYLHHRDLGVFSLVGVRNFVSRCHFLCLGVFYRDAVAIRKLFCSYPIFRLSVYQKADSSDGRASPKRCRQYYCQKALVCSSVCFRVHTLSEGLSSTDAGLEPSLRSKKRSKESRKGRYAKFVPWEARISSSGLQEPQRGVLYLCGYEIHHGIFVSSICERSKKWQEKEPWKMSFGLKLI